MASALTSLCGKPLVVVTATKDQQTGWSTTQDRLAALSSNTNHRLAQVPHAALLDERNGPEISVRAIADAMVSVRTRSPVATPMSPFMTPVLVPGPEANPGTDAQVPSPRPCIECHRQTACTRHERPIRDGRLNDDQRRSVHY